MTSVVKPNPNSSKSSENSNKTVMINFEESTKKQLQEATSTSGFDCDDISEITSSMQTSSLQRLTSTDVTNTVGNVIYPELPVKLENSVDIKSEESVLTIDNTLNSDKIKSENVFNEYEDIIDGFSICSFNTEEDIMNYAAIHDKQPEPPINDADQFSKIKRIPKIRKIGKSIKNHKENMDIYDFQINNDAGSPSNKNDGNHGNGHHINDMMPKTFSNKLGIKKSHSALLYLSSSSSSSSSSCSSLIPSSSSAAASAAATAQQYRRLKFKLKTPFDNTMIQNGNDCSNDASQGMMMMMMTEDGGKKAVKGNLAESSLEENNNVVSTTTPDNLSVVHTTPQLLPQSQQPQSISTQHQQQQQQSSSSSPNSNNSSIPPPLYHHEHLYHHHHHIYRHHSHLTHNRHLDPETVDAAAVMASGVALKNPSLRFLKLEDEVIMNPANYTSLNKEIASKQLVQLKESTATNGFDENNMDLLSTSSSSVTMTTTSTATNGTTTINNNNNCQRKPLSTTNNNNNNNNNNVGNNEMVEQENMKLKIENDSNNNIDENSNKISQSEKCVTKSDESNVKSELSTDQHDPTTLSPSNNNTTNLSQTARQHTSSLVTTPTTNNNSNLLDSTQQQRLLMATTDKFLASATAVAAMNNSNNQQQPPSPMSSWLQLQMQNHQQQHGNKLAGSNSFYGNIPSGFPQQSHSHGNSHHSHPYMTPHGSLKNGSVIPNGSTNKMSTNSHHLNPSNTNNKQITNKYPPQVPPNGHNTDWPDLSAAYLSRIAAALGGAMPPPQPATNQADHHHSSSVAAAAAAALAAGNNHPSDYYNAAFGHHHHHPAAAAAAHQHGLLAGTHRMLNNNAGNNGNHRYTIEQQEMLNSLRFKPASKMSKTLAPPIPGPSTPIPPSVPVNSRHVPHYPHPSHPSYPPHHPFGGLSSSHPPHHPHPSQHPHPYQPTPTTDMLPSHNAVGSNKMPQSTNSSFQKKSPSTSNLLLANPTANKDSFNKPVKSAAINSLSSGSNGPCGNNSGPSSFKAPDNVKKRGYWCDMHVKIANFIDRSQKQRIALQQSTNTPSTTNNTQNAHKTTQQSSTNSQSSSITKPSSSSSLSSHNQAMIMQQMLSAAGYTGYSAPPPGAVQGASTPSSVTTHKPPQPSSSSSFHHHPTNKMHHHHHHHHPSHNQHHPHHHQSSTNNPQHFDPESLSRKAYYEEIQEQQKWLRFFSQFNSTAGSMPSSFLPPGSSNPTEQQMISQFYTWLSQLTSSNSNSSSSTSPPLANPQHYEYFKNYLDKFAPNFLKSASSSSNIPELHPSMYQTNPSSAAPSANAASAILEMQSYLMNQQKYKAPTTQQHTPNPPKPTPPITPFLNPMIPQQSQQSANYYKKLAEINKSIYSSPFHSSVPHHPFYASPSSSSSSQYLHETLSSLYSPYLHKLQPNYNNKNGFNIPTPTTTINPHPASSSEPTIKKRRLDSSPKPQTPSVQSQHDNDSNKDDKKLIISSPINLDLTTDDKDSASLVQQPPKHDQNNNTNNSPSNDTNVQQIVDQKPIEPIQNVDNIKLEDIKLKVSDNNDNVTLNETELI